MLFYSEIDISLVYRESCRVHCSIARSLFHIQKSFILVRGDYYAAILLAVRAPIVWNAFHIIGSRISKKEGAFTPLGFSAFFSYLCFCLLACRSKSFFSAFSHLVDAISCIFYISIFIYSMIT